MASLLRVKFPNPFGDQAAASSAVAALQKQLGFSDAYASLLGGQNGFRVGTLEDAKGRDAFLAPTDATSPGLDFAQLFTVAELGDAQRRIRSLGAWFVAIGKGYGGDQYAEVLHGAHRGSIVHLNKEIFLGASSFSEIAEGYDDFEDFDIDFKKLSVGQQADFLVETEDLDLVARMAPSIDDFLALCVHCDTERFMGCAVAAPEGTGGKKGKAEKKAKAIAAPKKPAAKKKAKAAMPVAKKKAAPKKKRSGGSKR